MKDNIRGSIDKIEIKYAKLLALADELMELSRHKKDESISSLLNLVASNIQSYENSHHRCENHH